MGSDIVCCCLLRVVCSCSVCRCVDALLALRGPDFLRRFDCFCEVSIFSNIITHTFSTCQTMQTEYCASRPPRFRTPQQSGAKSWAGYGKGTTCVSGGPRRIRASSEYGRCDWPTPKDSVATRSRSRVRCTNTTSGGSERGALVSYLLPP